MWSKVSSAEALKQVYRHLSLIVHTDKCVIGGDGEMKQLNAMMERLSEVLEG